MWRSDYFTPPFCFFTTLLSATTMNTIENSADLIPPPKAMRFIEKAYKHSHHSDHHTFKLGCVIVYKNRIISCGFNSLKTHTQSPDTWKSTHAEFAAIKSLSRKDILCDCTMYIARKNKLGEWANARPCEDCMMFLESLGLGKIVYTKEHCEYCVERLA
jgi:deoxycytidylate deaminase